MGWDSVVVFLGHSVQWVAGILWESVRAVALYPVSFTQRLWIPFVLSSAVVGAWVYLRRSRRGSETSLREIADFLFPARVWRHPSTRVDLRYFLPHQMVRVWIYGAFSAAIFLGVAAWVKGLWHTMLGPGPTLSGVDSIGVRALVSIVVVVLVDASGYLIHVLLHKVPVLWEFHRVHHSAQALNPFTTYREHPVDNLLFAAGGAITAGTVIGSVLALFGARPSEIGLLGMSVPVLLYYVVGYHLRHSHIWLRWPGVWGIVFGSPAHHQVHHSCRPEHVDKNLAFIFPVWDLLFGTLCLPEEEPDLVFGLGDGTEQMYDGFLHIYLLPFQRLFSRYVRRRAPAPGPELAG